jgi:hypothetical protein
MMRIITNQVPLTTLPAPWMVQNIPTELFAEEAGMSTGGTFALPTGIMENPSDVLTESVSEYAGV